MDGTNCSNMGGVKEHWTFFYDGDGVRVKETHTDFETSPTTITTRLFLFGGTYEINDDGDITDNYYDVGEDGIPWEHHIKYRDNSSIKTTKIGFTPPFQSIGGFPIIQ